MTSDLIEPDFAELDYNKTHLKGVPVTVKVPTHVKIVIRETQWATIEAEDGEKVQLSPVSYEETVEEVSEKGKVESVTYLRPLAQVDVFHEFIETEKIFTVDPKRPAAGTLDLSLKFQDQYITSIQSTLKDETIADVSKALERILGGIANLRQGGLAAGFSGANLGEGVDTSVKSITSVKAAAIFELEDPAFEVQVSEFLAMHLPGQGLAIGPSCPHVGSRTPPTTQFVQSNTTADSSGPLPVLPLQSTPIGEFLAPRMSQSESQYVR